MKEFSKDAFNILNKLYKEKRLDCVNEYYPLIHAISTLAEYEQTGLMPKEVVIFHERLEDYQNKLTEYEPIVHAYWERTGNWQVVKCSNCNRLHSIMWDETRCPYCGAIMDEDL